MSFTKHHEFGHEGYVDGFPIEFGGHLGRLGYVATVHQPEPSRDGGGEADAVVDEGEGRGAGDVFPLSTSCAAWKCDQSEYKQPLILVEKKNNNYEDFPKSKNFLELITAKAF